jgi:thioredoxin reductase (NADPH)
MSDAAPPIPVPAATREERTFPVLTPEQIARLAPHGERRPIRAGEVLIEAGDQVVPFLVVLAGEVEIVLPAHDGETRVAAHGPGQFSGEVNMLSGRRALFRARAKADGEVLKLDREALMKFVQTDTELSEILLRAFILRRVELITHGLGDVILLGSSHCANTLGVREFLTRNGHPFTYVDLDAEADVQELLDRFQVTEIDVPVLICRGDVVLRNPSNQQIADCLGFNDAIDPTQVRDLVIVGAGPAGLASAVYGASEGLDVLVLESNVPGGQAGSSSRIENYLGFPTGISGNELTARAHTQAEKFGAKVAVARGARRLSCDLRYRFALEMDNGEKVVARAVILATGAQYRKLKVAEMARFEGAGVYYGATFMEAQLCRDEEVVVVGGGNSAGQAAVFLAETSKRVHVLVRADGLADTMSRYLVRRIEQNDRIELHTRTEITALQGNEHLERVRWRGAGGEEEARDVRHVFVMTGAVPSTGWLGGCVTLDGKGFIKTGTDLTREDLEAAGWPLTRAPFLLETSRPGLFAVGDVRGHNIKRIASAVGEGSIAVSFVHQVLQER